ncbi:MAG: hypothetical protein U1F58_07255 [Burkholderiales bacterium]
MPLPLFLHRFTFFAVILGTLVRDRRNSRRAFESRRDRSLRALLRHARQRVPFQRSRLAGVDLDDIRLDAIAPTTKTAMMASFDETIADGVVSLAEVQATEDASHRLELPIVRGRYLVVKTSGTSGEPSWLVCGLTEWAILRGATFARMARNWLTLRTVLAGRGRPLKAATLAAAHAHSMTWQAARSTQKWAWPWVHSRFFPVIDSVERIVQGLNAFRPRYLHTYPTAAEMLARHRLAGGTFAFEPELLSVGSEPLTDIARAAIRQAFPATELVNHYGMSECLPLSTECRCGRLHINTDFAILEAMDAQGRPVAPGELSDHVLVTNLVNRLQPIIRYRVEDSVRIHDEPCACGSVRPVVEVESRKGSQIHLTDDRGGWQMLSPPIVVDTMLHAQGVALFQVVHARQNELEVKFIPIAAAEGAAAGDSIRQAFASTLRRLGCAGSVKVAVEQVEVLERTALGGKLLQTVSRVAPPAARAPAPD